MILFSFLWVREAFSASRLRSLHSAQVLDGELGGRVRLHVALEHFFSSSSQSRSDKVD